MVTSDRECSVFVALPGQSDYVIAGRLRVSITPGGSPLGEFVYGHSYLNRPAAVDLDPVRLRLGERVRRTRSSDGLFGAIRDAIPTRWGGMLRGGVGRLLHEVDYLTQGPSEHVGAISLAPGLEPPRPKRHFDTLDDLGRLQAAADAVVASKDARRRRGTLQVEQPFPKNRPNAVVEDDRVLWLVKFVQEHRTWDHSRVRHATLELARECGLDANPSRIERVHGEDILMVRRYDRQWMGDGYACSRLISGLTLLGTDHSPAEKRRWSYLTLADEVRRASSHPRVDLCELFGRMCFNAAISNLSDDLRYPMLVGQGSGWRLVPASNLAPEPLTDGARGEFTMIHGPGGRVPSRENIVGGAGRFLLDRAAAEAVFDRISGVVQSSWYAVMRRCGVSVEDCELVGRSIVGWGGEG